VLLSLKAQSRCQYVFTSMHDHTKPLTANTLAGQNRDVMKTCSFHPDAGLHALRHTFLTDAGRYTKNVKALQRLGGHFRIQTTIRYVHPDESVHVGNCQRPTAVQSSPESLQFSLQSRRKRTQARRKM
jgi:site-specific recombinase XerD